MFSRIFDVASALVVVGGLLVLARPGSQGPALVDSFTHGFEGALGVATGAGVSSGAGPGGFSVAHGVLA